jgi:CIC family chloride channel protein
MGFRLLHIANSLVSKIHLILNNKQFIIFSSILVGLSAGIAAVILKTFVHYIRLFLFESEIPEIKYLYLLFPIIGIAMVVFLVKPFLKNDVRVGGVGILHAIAKKGSFLPFEKMYSYIITSGLTIGFGGSAGLESPIVSTGAAVGSNFARVNKLTYKERTLLLAAGTAGGISAAFNAPIAGVLFALEVILVDISITAFIPLLIASVSGALMSNIILKEGILLSFQNLKPFDYHNVPFYIVLACLTSLISLYYVNFFQKLETLFEKVRSNTLRMISGCLILVILLFVFPPLFGEGYDSIKLLSLNQFEKIFKDSPLYLLAFSKVGAILILFAVMLLKVVAASVTIGAGGVGGNFAPSLFVGAYLGYIFAYICGLLNFELPVNNFTLVAMAGILSGVFHSPLTAIFLIAEISGGYSLIIPLMIVSAFSYLIVKYFHPESMDIKKLNNSGAIISENKDINILSRIDLSKLIEKDFAQLCPNDPLRTVIENVKQSKRNVFPVVDKNNYLKGVVKLDSIREELFEPNLYDRVLVKEIMEKVSVSIALQDTIITVIKKFEETGEWNLPVVENGIYLGFLSKSSILSTYRNELIYSYN